MPTGCCWAPGSSRGAPRSSWTRTTTPWSGRPRRARRQSPSSRHLPSAPDLVPVGLVGRPHGLDGSFFVEGPSERAATFATGATLYVDGEPAKVVSSKRGSHDRPVIRLDRRVQRGATLAVPREALPPLEAAAYHTFPLAGLAAGEGRGRGGGRGRDVPHYPADHVPEPDAGPCPALARA